MTAQRWSSALGRLGIDLRPGEQAAVLVLFSYSFLLGIFQFSSKAVRQATFVDALGAERLPWVYLAVAVAAYPTLRLYNALARRASSGGVIRATAIGVGLALLGFWWLMARPSAVVSFSYYLAIAIAIALTLSQLWSYVNATLDARQARRLFGLIGSGALLGGVVGGQVASWAGATEPRAALIAGALVMFAIAVLVPWSEATGHTRAVSLGAESGPSDSRWGPGLAIIGRSAHLRVIATILVLTVVVAEIVDLQFNWVVEQSTSGLGQRTALFGNVFSIMGLAAFVFQLLVTGRIHRTLGVGFAMRVLPVFVLVLSLLIGAADLLAPSLLVLVLSLLKVGDNGLRYSLDHATRELLFVPVPATQRALAKSYIDVLVHRSARGLGAVLLLTVTFGWVSVIETTWMTLVLVVLWLACTGVAQRRYVDSLRSGLAPRSGDGPLDPGSLIDPRDVTTLEVLIESLGSIDPDRVLRSLDLLARNRRAHLVPPVLVHHDDPRVRRRTIEVLTLAERRDALGWIERRIGDPEPDVRAAAIQALAALSGRDGPQLMAGRLDDPDPRVRAAAIGCLAEQGDSDQRAAADKAIAGMLSDGDPEVRREVAKALSGIPEPMLQEHVVALLYDGDSDVVAAAIGAVTARAAVLRNPLYVPILVSLLRDRRLKHEAREALVAYGKSVLPALAHFMNEPGEHIWVRRALPKTIARIGTELAAATLDQSLDRCRDPFLRRKIIEALGRCRSRPDRARLEHLVVEECRRYFEALVRLVAVSEPRQIELSGAVLRWRTGDPPDLLQRLLDERRQDHLKNLERLLALGAEREGIRRAWAGLLGGDGEARGRALEYLDNVLGGVTRRPVMAVVDDLPLEARLASGERLFGLRVRDRTLTLRSLVEEVQEGDESAPWLAAAAVHTIRERGVDDLRSKLAHWAQSATDPLVRETAIWAAASVIP